MPTLPETFLVLLALGLMLIGYLRGCAGARATLRPANIAANQARRGAPEDAAEGLVGAYDLPGRIHLI